MPYRIRLFLQDLVTPHPSIEGKGEKGRAQLLATLSLSLIILNLFGGIARSSYGIFLILAAIALITYSLSRTRYYYLGAYLLIYSLTSIAFVRIYQGTTGSIDTAISTSVHISLVLASALLPQGSFVILILLSTIATFASPLYSHVPANNTDNYIRTGGVVLTLGVILYGVNSFLANLDRRRLHELQDANRKLEQIKTNLEKHVAERTYELQDANRQMENRALRLEAISEISQSIATNMNLNLHELLSFITRSISEKTGFYHVGIFLLDQNHEYAVLRAANSPGGKRMLERRHQLKVGSTGIVGYVAQGGRPRIALDTGTDAVFFNNPDLPETRSEMTLPLKVGAQVIGTLDVQSSAQSAFNDDDLTALSTLANQIAIIIQNSQLNEGGDPTSSVSKLTRRGAQLSRRSRKSGFTYLPDGTLSSATQIENSIINEALASGETVRLDQLSKTGLPSLAVPVKLRDQIIGIIHIEAVDGKRKWTEDEITMVEAVSERAALAIENAGLFEASERRVTQERVVAEVTSRIGESNDMERILQTTIQELGRSLGARRAFIQLGAPVDKDSEEVDLLARLANGEEDRS